MARVPVRALSVALAVLVVVFLVVLRLEVESVRVAPSPLSPPPSFRPTPAPQNEVKIFYFGVTHPSRIEGTLAAELTWAPRCSPSFPWYSTEEDPRVKNLTVILPSQGDSYQALYYRTQLIWRHVWETYPDHDWYVRVWPDNFVFPERMEEVARQYDPSQLVEVGRLLTHLSWAGPYPSGGATSLVSRALLKKHIDNLSSCSPEVRENEDVTIGMCRRKLGARFVHHYGFYAHAPHPYQSGVGGGKQSLNLFLSDLSCRRKFQESGGEPFVLPVSLHYISPMGILAVDKAWYSTPCDQALPRAEEERRFGSGNFGRVEEEQI